MAWIEVHQSLPTHRKTKSLARLLGIKMPSGMPQVVGHLVMLWMWCYDNALDGDLTGIDEQDIADAAGWCKSPRDFIDALCASGYVDDDMHIHDWDEYAGKYATKVESRKDGNKVRQQRYRDRKKQLASNVTHNALEECNVARNDDVTSRVTRNASNASTVPNRTVPNLTVPNHTADAVYARDGGDGDLTEIADDLERNILRVESAITGMGMPFAARDRDTANLLLADYPVDWVLEAITRTADAQQDARSWRYIKGILRSWREKGGIDDAINAGGSGKRAGSTGGGSDYSYLADTIINV